MMFRKYTILSFVLSAMFAAPSFAFAASGFEVTGWLPYWRSATSTADVLPHLSQVTEVNPFVYTIKSDGTLVDNGSLDTEPWVSFIAAAKQQKVRVIPTVMTGNSELLHEILSDTQKRVAFEDRIAQLVKEKNFDGIDIDFEGKKAEDKDYFSTFLKGLYQRMGQKWVMCTIESRTPTDSRYYGTDIPPDATIYANDLVEINKYCDRVRIMAYDQQGIDLQLSSAAASSSQLYAPVADPAWVEKVVNLMAKDIKRSKILIGVPTYGYEYDVTAYANNQYVYNILWTFNPGYAWPIAQQYGVTPQRNAAGEMFFTYVANSATTSPPTSLGPNSAALAAAAASQYATQYNSHLNFRLMDWPDAQSIQTKIDLAISIFKWDGGEDPAIWNVLAGVAGSSSASGGSTAGSGSSGSSVSLARGLDIGSTGADVRTLQRILNSDSDTRVAASGTGSPGNESTYFGPATAAAVKKFQVKWGIAKAGNAGYGYVGPSTRAKLNAVLGTM
ncbi:peptidoglycan-binding protein [Candidatus Kaiserbacteria bacterium]|nr:peptidoglycan-binding protein [Candidatus Kaiserbacteria bacterium]